MDIGAFGVENDAVGIVVRGDERHVIAGIVADDERELSAARAVDTDRRGIGETHLLEIGRREAIDTTRRDRHLTPLARRQDGRLRKRLRPQEDVRERQREKSEGEAK